jgi:hypothetical protein
MITKVQHLVKVEEIEEWGGSKYVS